MSFQILHIRYIVQYFSFSVWLTSLSVTISRFIHVVVNGIISFFFMTEQYFIGLPQWLSGKESIYNAGDSGDMGLIPGSGKYPGGGLGDLLQSSCWENPVDRGAWLPSMETTETCMLKGHVACLGSFQASFTLEKSQGPNSINPYCA